MPEVKWFYSENNQQKGPVSEDQMRSMLASGQIPPTTLVWRKGFSDWMPANQIAELSGQPTQRAPVSNYQPAPAINPAQAPGAPPAPSSAHPGELGDLLAQAMEKKRRTQEAEALKAMDERWHERQRQEREGKSKDEKEKADRMKAATGGKVIRPAAHIFYFVSFMTAILGVIIMCTGKSPLPGGTSSLPLLEGGIDCFFAILWALLAYFAKRVTWVYITGTVLFAIDGVLSIVTGGLTPMGIIVKCILIGALVRGFKGKPASIYD